MLDRTHIPEAPWWVVPADDKKKARLNCIDHLLNQVPYGEVPHDEVALPARVRNEDYERHPVPSTMLVPVPSCVTPENPLRFSTVSAADALDEVIYQINLVEDARRVAD